VKGKVECVNGIILPQGFFGRRKACNAILSYSVECEENVRAGAELGVSEAY
jgi:hypothetical protein